MQRPDEPYDRQFHRDNQLAHAGRRMRERFGRDIAPTTLNLLSQMLKKGKGKLIATQPPGHTIWDLDYRGLSLRLVFHKKTKAIATVLTRDQWNDRWSAVPRWKQRPMHGTHPASIALHQGGKPTLYLYTHERGADVLTLIARALKKGRSWWAVPESLNQVILTELKRGHEDDIQNFALGTEPLCKNVIHVWHDRQLVQVCTRGPSHTFRDFLERFHEENS